MRVRLPSGLRRLVPATAALVVGMLLGSAAPASADGGVVHACVYTDRHGEFHGDLRIVGAHERCRRWETRLTIPLAGPGGGSGSGDYAPALGGIKGVLLECGLLKPFLAYLNGHSFVVHIGLNVHGDVETGQFEMHSVPPGMYDLHMFGPRTSLIREEVQVIAGQITDLQTIDTCPPDGG